MSNACTFLKEIGHQDLGMIDYLFFVLDFSDYKDSIER